MVFGVIYRIFFNIFYSISSKLIRKISGKPPRKLKINPGNSEFPFVGRSLTKISGEFEKEEALFVWNKETIIASRGSRTSKEIHNSIRGMLNGTIGGNWKTFSEDVERKERERRQYIRKKFL